VSFFGDEKRDQKQHLYDEFQQIIARIESQALPGAAGEVKNLIFAANGPKPEIVLRDAAVNQIEIVKNKEYCLVYNRPISERGLSWEELVDWWRDREGLGGMERSDQRWGLYHRLLESIAKNECECILFKTYFARFWESLESKLPALLPQVYLHFDPYTVRQLGGIKRLPRQRMDFLLLLPYNRRVVIEIDGKQHYSEGNVPSPERYAEMVAEDRRIQLAGYEVYRFGGHEFVNKASAARAVEGFFAMLFNYHSITGSIGFQQVSI
jgi:hypothetical protein